MCVVHRTLACMPVPSFDKFVEPLLRYLASHTSPVAASDAHDAVADTLGLSEDERAERMPNGLQLRYRYRNHWAHDRLKRAGYSSSPSRGLWLLTAAGRDVALRTSRLTDADIERLVRVDWTAVRGQRELGRRGERENASAAIGVEPLARAALTPVDQIQSALAEIQETVANELLENIAHCSPAFFEHLVLDLLLALGYGADANALKRTGRSGDEGIDGIIWLDKLGLEKVYVQAKRWKGAVGSPEVQTFLGALHLQGASKGVLLTTGRVTSDAIKLAERGTVRLALVDGTRLAALMIEHGVAVAHTDVRIPAINNDYFDGE